MGHALPSRRQSRDPEDASCSTPTAKIFAPIAWWWPAAGCRFLKIGASPLGYRLAEQFCDPRLGTAPRAGPADLAARTLARLRPLLGLPSTPSRAAASDVFREKALTHRGLSGPAILQVSSYWRHQADAAGGREPVRLDLLPGSDARRQCWKHRTNRSLLPKFIPERMATRKRFAQAWCELHDCSGPLNRMSAKTIAHIPTLLNGWPLHPSGTQGYAKAEVTLGGVDTRALSSKTMEARELPGLFFIGEVVDVTEPPRRLQLPVGLVVRTRRRLLRLTRAGVIALSREALGFRHLMTRPSHGAGTPIFISDVHLWHLRPPGPSDCSIFCATMNGESLSSATSSTSGR